METLKDIANAIKCIDCECDVGAIAKSITDLDKSLCNLNRMNRKDRKIIQLNLNMILKDLKENNEYVRNG